MKNPILEGRQLMAELFDKMEKILEENVLVVAEIERQRYKTERKVDADV